MPAMASQNYVTASEIGEYVYCPRGWWLKTRGSNLVTPQMVKGIAHHESILSKLNWNFRLKIIALLLIGIAIMIILIIARSLLGLI